MKIAFFGGLFSAQHSMEFLVPAAGIIVSILIWRRFGLHYAFLGAMLFVLWLANAWTSSNVAQHLIVVASFVVGLIAVAALRPGVASRTSTLSIPSPKRFSASEFMWRSTSSFHR